jgi:sulfate-transporting ATPase
VTVGETVELGVSEQLRDDLDDNKTVYEEICDGEETLDLGNYVLPIRVYLAAFNFKGQAQEKRVGKLSGGERNRLHIAKV